MGSGGISGTRAPPADGYKTMEEDIGSGTIAPDVYLAVEQGNDVMIRRAMSKNLEEFATFAKSGQDVHGEMLVHHALLKEPGDTNKCLQAVMGLPGVDINSRSQSGFTPLQLAVLQGKDGAVRILVAAGAKRDIQTAEGQTALHMAANLNQPACIQAFIDCGTPVNTADLMGQTPLQSAASLGHLECVEVLLTGKNNGINAEGYLTKTTALHEAAATGQDEIVELLLRAGANSEAVNHIGQMPGDLAAEGGHWKLAERLQPSRKEEDMSEGTLRVTSALSSSNTGLLDAEEVMRRRVQDLIDDTWKDSTLDRDVSKAYRLEVIQVLKNTNDTLWTEYCKRREEVSLHYVKHLEDVKTVIPIWESGLEQARLPSVNEFFLFHGTKPEAVSDICKTGFSRESLSESAIFFSESSVKADEYAQDDRDGIYRGLFAMLLCRVTLGNPVINEVTPDVKEISRLLVAGGRHSIVDDRRKTLGTHREFILQEARQVYPEFAVVYRRKAIRI